MSRVKIHIQDLIDDPSGVLKPGESSFSVKMWKKLADNCKTDITYLPVDDSVDVSVISEEDWHNLVGTPGTEDSFNTSEQAYLSSLGCTWDAL